MKRPIRCLTLSVALLSSSLAYANDRPLYNAYLEAPAVTPSTRASSGPSVAVASTDEMRGVPSFIWAAKGPAGRAAPAAIAGITPQKAALFHLTEHAATYGVPLTAVSTAKVTHVHDTGR